MGESSKHVVALAALQRGEANFTVTNATAERARVVDFAPPLVDLELGVLVPPASRVDAVDRLDQPGVTVGVSQGSSSERVLGGRWGAEHLARATAWAGLRGTAAPAP